jgi:TPR repeat protein
MVRRLRALLDRSGFGAHQLGAEYATRSDEPKDQQKALKWYGYGAKLGDLESMYDLGFMTLLGEGRPADKKEAQVVFESCSAGP